MSKIEINNVYKIFGPKPNQVLEMVKGGSGKDEILEKTGHTVGLDNVSLKIEEGDVYSASKIESNINIITKLVNEKGFPFTETFPEVDRIENKNELSVLFRINEAEKKYVNRIIIRGTQNAAGTITGLGNEAVTITDTSINASALITLDGLIFNNWSYK